MNGRRSRSMTFLDGRSESSRATASGRAYPQASTSFVHLIAKIDPCAS
jgi:hypothetical protein